MSRASKITAEHLATYQGLLSAGYVSRVVAWLAGDWEHEDGELYGVMRARGAVIDFAQELALHHHGGTTPRAAAANLGARLSLHRGGSLTAALQAERVFRWRRSSGQG